MILVAFFILGYLINIIFISVFYHRALAHQSVILSPLLRRLVFLTGNWVTGLDPVAWCCMHRLHHLYSDTAKDPHSPVNHGILRVFSAQLKSYEITLVRLLRRDANYLRVVEDLEHTINPLNARGLWYLPYLFQALISIAISGLSGNVWAGLAYYFGIMSHPIQGWLVNSLGHAVGYRNFETPDQSRNNLPVGWLVFGEGFQNNHHFRPYSAKFSERWWEIDLGYFICNIFRFMGLLSFPNYIPAPIKAETEVIES